MEAKVALSDVLAHLGDELVVAEENARQRGFGLMQFEECELEFTFQVEKDVGGKAKIWVIEVGGDAKWSESNKIRMKFTKIPGQVVQAGQVVSNKTETPEPELPPGPPLVRQTRK